MLRMILKKDTPTDHHRVPDVQIITTESVKNVNVRNQIETIVIESTGNVSAKDKNVSVKNANAWSESVKSVIG
jgi:hypothetical protein